MIEGRDLLELIQFADETVSNTDIYLKAVMLDTLDTFEYELELSDSVWYDFGIYKIYVSHYGRTVELYVDLYFFKYDYPNKLKGTNKIIYINEIINNKEMKTEHLTVKYHIISDKMAKEKNIKYFDFTYKDINTQYLLYSITDLDIDIDIGGITCYFDNILMSAEYIEKLLRFHDMQAECTDVHVKEEYIKKLLDNGIVLNCTNTASYIMDFDDFTSDYMLELHEWLVDNKNVSVTMGFIVDDTPIPNVKNWFIKYIKRLKKLELQPEKILVYFLSALEDEPLAGPAVCFRDIDTTKYYKRLYYPYVYDLDGFKDYFNMYVRDRLG